MTSGLIQYGVPLTDLRSLVFPKLKLYEQKHINFIDQLVKIKSIRLSIFFQKILNTLGQTLGQIPSDHSFIQEHCYPNKLPWEKQ